MSQTTALGDPFASIDPTSGADMSGDPSGTTISTTPPSSIYGYSADEETQQVPYEAPGAPGAPGQVVADAAGLGGDPNGTEHTFGKVMKDFANLRAVNPSDFQGIQAQMYAGGFYDGKLKAGQSPAYGRADKATIDAYHDVVAEAVRSGKTPQEVLSDAASTAQPGSNAPDVSIPNPVMVKGVAQTVAQHLVGRYLSDDQVNTIVNDVQNNARHSQTQFQYNPATGYNESLSDPTSSVYMKDYVAQDIRQAMPNQVAATSLANNIAEFANLLQSSKAGMTFNTSDVNGPSY